MSKMSPSAMVYATGWKSSPKQSPVYAAQPAAPALVPLTLRQMEAGREQIFSVNNPFCPCDSKTFRKVAEWVERHHGIGQPVGGER